jgi:hypothetical protein
LRDYAPPIFLDQGAIDQGVLQIAAICLRDEDVEIVGSAVEAFCRPAAAARPDRPRPSAKSG